MPDSARQTDNSQTLCVELKDLVFEILERREELATVIRFRLENQDVRIGDVLVVLRADDICFHGLIGYIDGAGWAVAADRRGSKIPVAVQ
jgi:hypothetical protein